MSVLRRAVDYHGNKQARARLAWTDDLQFLRCGEARSSAIQENAEGGGKSRRTRVEQEGAMSEAKPETIVGNAAAMRGALEWIARQGAELIVETDESERIGRADKMELCGRISLLCQRANAALVASPRNCDVGTVEEQTKRMQKEYCDKCECYVMPSDEEPYGCPLHESGVDCRFKWAQMPYKAMDRAMNGAAQDSGGTEARRARDRGTEARRARDGGTEARRPRDREGESK